MCHSIVDMFFFGDALGRSFCEHRGEILIYDVDVVKSDAMKNQRSPRVSGDMGGLLETHWGLLSVQ